MTTMQATNAAILEKKSAHMSRIVDLWAPLLAKDLIAIGEFKKKILEAVEFQETMAKYWEDK